jgi:hypothetical protein
MDDVWLDEINDEQKVFCPTIPHSAVYEAEDFRELVME